MTTTDSTHSDLTGNMSVFVSDLITVYESAVVCLHWEKRRGKY